MTRAEGEKMRHDFMTGKAADAKKFFGLANEMRSDGKWLIDPSIARAANELEQKAWKSVGEMLHPVMDSTSPAHQDNSGKGQGWGLWDKDLHVLNHGPQPGSMENKINSAQMDETLKRVDSAMNQYLPEVARGEQNKIPRQ